LDDAGFRKFFAGTPIKRSGRDNFIRNVLMALGNMAAPTSTHIEAVRARLGDEAELVRASAVWALGQMLDMNAADIDSLRRHMAHNGDHDEAGLVAEELAHLEN
jgi:epoxyqueuosine reductase